MAALTEGCVTPSLRRWCVCLTSGVGRAGASCEDVTVAGTGLFMESAQVFPCCSVGRFSCSGLSLHLASRAKVHTGKSKGTCDIRVLFPTAWGNERGRKGVYQADRPVTEAFRAAISPLKGARCPLDKPREIMCISWSHFYSF